MCADLGGDCPALRWRSNPVPGSGIPSGQGPEAAFLESPTSLMKPVSLVDYARMSVSFGIKLDGARAPSGASLSATTQRWPIPVEESV